MSHYQRRGVTAGGDPRLMLTRTAGFVSMCGVPLDAAGALSGNS